jgi:hypothetical protein
MQCPRPSKKTELEILVANCEEGGRLRRQRDLTVLERDEHVAEWIRLTEAKLESDKLLQSEAVSKGGRGNEGGVRAAARSLGIEQADAHRAVKVAGLSDEAKAAREIAAWYNEIV